MEKINFWLANFTNKLNNKSQIFKTLYLGLAAFFAYSCMYALRKPFTVALFSDTTLLGINYKLVLVIAQLMGYTTAKFIGIKLISEVTPAKRPTYIIGLVVYSLVALGMFAIIPAPDNWPFMYLNGLGLGMIYGLIFSYLEGRRITEILSAFLIISFIVSSGFMKSVGDLFLKTGMTESAMPFVVGLIFLPLFLISVGLLFLAPAPDFIDKQTRAERVPMTDTDRKRFVKKYDLGLFALIFSYIVLTIFRDIRDNFSAEIWANLGFKSSSIFTISEIIIGVFIAFNIALGVKIKNNKMAFYANHFFIIFGCLITYFSTKTYLANYTSAFWWMVLSGMGIYMAYIPFNGVLFDRLLAVLKEKANVSFLFFMADFAGYLGTIGVMIFQIYSPKNINWLDLILNMAIGLPILTILLVIVSFFFFNSKPAFQNNPNQGMAIS